MKGRMAGQETPSVRPYHRHKLNFSNTLLLTGGRGPHIHSHSAGSPTPALHSDDVLGTVLDMGGWLCISTIRLPVSSSVSPCGRLHDGLDIGARGRHIAKLPIEDLLGVLRPSLSAQSVLPSFL